MNDFICGACAGCLVGLSTVLVINHLWYVRASKLMEKIELDKALISDALQAIKRYRVREQKARMMAELSKPMAGTGSSHTDCIKVGNGNKGLKNRRYVG